MERGGRKGVERPEEWREKEVGREWRGQKSGERRR